jgi:dolichol-phosphate mannosyltransferase
VAIPFFNDADVLPELRRRLGQVLDQLPGGPHEVVLVDDGSEDGSRELLAQAAAEDPRFVVLFLSRNFGQQAALTAALDHATGDAVVLLDADLQDPPEAIPAFVAKHQEGYDVVYARRVRRKEGPLLRACYYLFYRLLALLSDTPLALDSGDFGLLSRRVVDTLRAMPEQNRYLRGLRSWIGFRQIGLTVERHERYAGESKYTLRRLVKLALDGIFSFSLVPLRLASLAGCGALAASCGYALYALVVRFLGGGSPPGFTALIVAVVFLSGVQLLSLGVVGEYVGRLYQETKRRPHYIVERVLRQS